MTTPIDLPPMVAHPDPHAFNWSKAELRALKSYATAAVLADRAAAQPVQPTVSVDALAQEIRRVDGAHTLGAGALAKALMLFLANTVQPVQPAASAAGPKELWLQLHGDCSADELLEPVDYTGGEVTWCWHAINNSDVRYVREDLAQPASTKEAT